MLLLLFALISLYLYEIYDYLISMVAVSGESSELIHRQYFNTSAHGSVFFFNCYYFLFFYCVCVCVRLLCLYYFFFLNSITPNTALEK